MNVSAVKPSKLGSSMKMRWNWRERWAKLVGMPRVGRTSLMDEPGGLGIWMEMREINQEPCPMTEVEVSVRMFADGGILCPKVTWTWKSLT